MENSSKEEEGGEGEEDGDKIMIILCKESALIVFWPRHHVERDKL